MRYFVVQDQLKTEIYDINGNVFHSKINRFLIKAFNNNFVNREH